ncbi:hypothetical protein LMG10661_03003 [Ralstonia syzygii subsp. syzygii]|nr:hypothetical protein LMG10661_03003 [Ralstonia syzygii subsp. syzygii]
MLCAQKLVRDEPFAVILADDLLDHEPPVMRQMTELYDHYRCSIVGVETIAPQASRSYGVVAGREWDDRLIKLDGIVEKPAPERAPSNLGVVGRYILTPRIFDHLLNLAPGAGGEIQLTDAIQSLMTEEQILAYRALRLRQPVRLSAGHRRVGAAPSGGWRGVRGLSVCADGPAA